MAIILPHGLTPEEIRVLQEYRRTNSDVMSVDAIKAIKHPAGGGESPAGSLAEKGYLEPDATADNFAITPRGREFLAIEALPAVEETSAAAASAAENPDADGV